MTRPKGSKNKTATAAKPQKAEQPTVEAKRNKEPVQSSKKQPVEVVTGYVGYAPAVGDKIKFPNSVHVITDIRAGQVHVDMILTNTLETDTKTWKKLAANAKKKGLVVVRKDGSEVLF